jgi:hypothetical protein
MDYFPQLSTGNSLQYPLKKNQVCRTVTITSEDGRNSKYADNGWRSIQWELQFTELTREEWASLSNHFATAEGKLNTFPFSDGSDNLLKWSEMLSNNVWTVDPLLHSTEGIADPIGGMHGLRVQNAGTTWQGFSQRLPVPAAFTHCFSVYARSDGSTHLRISLSGNAQQTQREFALDTEWRRYVVTGSFSGTDELVTFGMQIDGSNPVDIYGMQVEPQTGASRYKRTLALNGVHPNTRYDQDELKLTSNRPDEYSTTIRLISREPL